MNYTLGPNDFQVGKTYYTDKGGEYTVVGRTRCYITVRFTKIPSDLSLLPDNRYRFQVANDMKGVEYACIEEQFRADQKVIA